MFGWFGFGSAEFWCLIDLNLVALDSIVWFV
jgi:hypothetical protein